MISYVDNWGDRFLLVESLKSHLDRYSCTVVMSSVEFFSDWLKGGLRRSVRHRQQYIFGRHSAGLTIVTNVAIATGPALLEAPQSVVLNFSLLYARGIFEFGCPRQTLRKRPIFYTHYTKTLFTESKCNFFYFVWEFASTWRSISHCKLFAVICF